MQYYSVVKKEGTLTFCHSMDGLGEYYAKWNKLVRERQITMISLVCLSLLLISSVSSLDSTNEWNHTVFVFLWLAYFT